jgi:hypothetical protein
MNVHQRLEALGVAVPEILLPAGGMANWAVIACDQFTRDRDYWAGLEAAVGESPSTLHLIFPEVYLEDAGRERRIKAIHLAMENYLANGVFAAPRRGFVYLERSTPYHPLRRGLVVAVDLERYDWKLGAASLIRATEGTVPERLPPRMDIRRGALLESPHILLLIDDENDAILPELGRRAKAHSALYHTELRPNAGAISGWPLDEPDDWNFFAGALEELADRARTRYEAAGTNNEHTNPGSAAPGTAPPGGGFLEPFLFAMGDGNHSLATAKAIWEEYKEAHRGEPGLEAHPARWALVELENLYDPGIAFEPIHRLILGASITEMETLLSRLPRPERSARLISTPAELSALVGDENAAHNRIGLIQNGRYSLLETTASGLITESLQPLLDEYLKHQSGASIDYIHGADELFRVSAQPAAVGLLLPPIKKSGLFQTVARWGPLPRKSFSMGESWEKRFYLECRQLFG